MTATGRKAERTDTMEIKTETSPREIATTLATTPAQPPKSDDYLYAEMVAKPQPAPAPGAIAGTCIADPSAGTLASCFYQPGAICNSYRGCARFAALANAAVLEHAAMVAKLFDLSAELARVNKALGLADQLAEDVDYILNDGVQDSRLKANLESYRAARGQA